MNDNTFSFEKSSSLTEQNKFIARVYGWMSLALIITGAVAFGVAVLAFNNAALFKSLFGAGFYILCLVEIGLVWFLSARIEKISVAGAYAGFLIYSIINGITLSSIFIVYQLPSIVSLFLVTALTFSVMAVYGSKTKRDILSWGKYLFMAVIGLIIASLVELALSLIFKQSFNFLRLGISVAGVIIFTLLAAYDARKVIVVSEHAQDNDTYKKSSIIGALELYLDFINIFVHLLRIFGKRR